MSRVLDRLMAGLPGYLDRDPAAEPALSVVPSGSATATVSGRVLTLEPAGSAPVVVPLAGRTLGDVAGAVTATPGFSASALADPSASAEALMDVDRQPLGRDNRLRRFTSPLWAVMTPIARALEETLANLRGGLLDASLKTADGQWVDLWGEDYYGAVRRMTAEQDRPFAGRIVREATRWRLNARALERILLEDFGAAASIANLHDRAWIVAETAFGRLAGRKYSRTTFEVALDAVSAEIAAAVERSRAAGTLPFFLVTDRGIGAVSSSPADARSAIVSTAVLAPDRVWTVGVDALGDGELSVFLDNEATELILVSRLEPVLRQVSGGGFSLGLSGLGAFPLGSGNSSLEVIALSDLTGVMASFRTPEAVAAPLETVVSVAGGFYQVAESQRPPSDATAATATYGAGEAVRAPSDAVGLVATLGSFPLGLAPLGN